MDNLHPFNHYKYCPRCAAIGNFDAGKYAFKCEECAFEFYLNASAAVAALIVNQSGELLLVRRGVEPDKGMLDLPGGFVDPGESAEEAVMREIKEELDIEPDKIEYFGSFPNEYKFSGTLVYTVDLAYKCLVTDFSNLKYRDDIEGLEFIRHEKINIDEIAFKSIREIIKMFQNEQNNKKQDSKVKEPDA
jgi:mutator protein MutT